MLAVIDAVILLVKVIIYFNIIYSVCQFEDGTSVGVTTIP